MPGLLPRGCFAGPARAVRCPDLVQPAVVHDELDGRLDLPQRVQAGELLPFSRPGCCSRLIVVPRFGPSPPPPARCRSGCDRPSVLGLGLPQVRLGLQLRPAEVGHGGPVADQLGPPTMASMASCTYGSLAVDARRRLVRVELHAAAAGPATPAAPPVPAATPPARTASPTAARRACRRWRGNARTSRSGTGHGAWPN